ncbi:MAG TPA: cytochrome c biogenesis protein ResB [Candidatus Sumerlaeota bacterium]|nr:cytochrome c biogenesis protein ResB [Candidatus Sumerlaeota bacterium]
MSQTASPKRLWHITPWKWLFSLKIGVTLLVVLAGVSIAGTLISPLDRALALVYYTAWYKSLLLLLALTMACATWRNLVEVVMPAFRDRFQKTEAAYRKRKPGAALRFEGSVADVATAFRAHGFRVALEGEFGYAWKGKIGRLGAPIAHLGLIGVLVSGFAAGMVAREGTVTVLEGEETRTLVIVPDFLAAGQIRDWKGFCQAVNRDRKDSSLNPGKQIWKMLGESSDPHGEDPSGLSHGQNLLLSLAGDEKVPYEYAGELAKELNNGVLARRDFYTPEAFKSVSLPTEAEKILAREDRTRTGDEMLRLNRLALEAAYPKWIKKSESVDLGFTIRCDDFRVSYHPRTKMPSEFVSTLSCPDTVPPIVGQTVEVNRSLTINGWTLHQTSYPEGPGMRFAVQVRDLKGPVDLEISPGQTRPVPGLDGAQLALEAQPPYAWTLTVPGQPEPFKGTLMGGAMGDRSSAPTAATASVPGAGAGFSIRAAQFEPDFVVQAGRKFGSRSQALNNPALCVALLQGGQEVSSSWVFGKPDMKDMMRNMMHQKESAWEFDLVRVTGEAPNYQMVVSAKKTGSTEAAREFTLTVGQEVALEAASPQATASASVAPTAPPATTASNSSDEPKVKLVGKVPAYYTILTLTRNPLIPVIYGGSVLMMFGLLLAFLVKRQEVWFWVRPGEKASLLVTAHYRLARDTFDRGTLGALRTLCPNEKFSSGEEAENGAE